MCAEGDFEISVSKSNFRHVAKIKSPMFPHQLFPSVHRLHSAQGNIPASCYAPSLTTHPTSAQSLLSCTASLASPTSRATNTHNSAPAQQHPRRVQCPFPFTRRGADLANCTTAHAHSPVSKHPSPPRVHTAHTGQTSPSPSQWMSRPSSSRSSRARRRRSTPSRPWTSTSTTQSLRTPSPRRRSSTPATKTTTATPPNHRAPPPPTPTPATSTRTMARASTRQTPTHRHGRATTTAIKRRTWASRTRGQAHRWVATQHQRLADAQIHTRSRMHGARSSQQSLPRIRVLSSRWAWSGTRRLARPV